MASVWTVASTTDWNVSTGGNLAIRPSRAAFAIARRRTRVIVSDCWPALTGKELYLYGLYSGKTSSHCDFSRYGTKASLASSSVNRGNGATPISGESRTILSARG